MVSLLLDLGICSNYPNGLFHFSCFKIGPWAEYFLVINGCSVECMHSNYPNTGITSCK